MINEKNIFIVGIKGAAMSNLAVILKKMGKKVTGSDVNEEFITDKILKKNKIDFSLGFSANDLPKQTELLIYGAAHGGTINPQVVEATKKGIKIKSQAEILGELINSFENTIAVCGCHGKTTVSSLLSYALINLEVKPSYLVGSPGFNQYPGGDYQDKKYFVIEADEYGVNPPIDKTPKFYYLHPKYIICTNIDFDHPDVYQDIEVTKQAFLKFFILRVLTTIVGKTFNQRLFFCADDENLMSVAKKLPSNSYLTFGFDSKADFRIIDYRTEVTDSVFSLIDNHKKTYQFRTGLFGEKNISNVSAVISFLLNQGFSHAAIEQAIADFTGAKRRFEKVAYLNDIYLFDDYAHHPAEINATINAAKERFNNRRLIVIFQPHTYSRTASLMGEFGRVLSLADYALLLPIFASARENPKDFQISSLDIVKKAKSNVLAFESKEKLIERLTSLVKKGDIIFTMGAGDVYKMSKNIIDILSSKFKVPACRQAWQSSKLEKLKEILGKERVEENKDISNFLTLHTSTGARYYFEARSKDDWQKVVKAAYELKIPLLVLGGGSNMVITNNLIEALVVKNLYLKKEIVKENKNEVELLVSSGYPTHKLVIENIDNGYEGLEYHKGLPGTIGGAVYMNSKWTKPLRYVGDYLIRAVLLDQQGNFKEISHGYFDFKYDFSVLHKTKEIIIDLIFKFKKVDKEILKQRAEEAVNYRLKTQPKGVASCGCFFRNISEKDRQRLNLPTNSVGYILDQLNLKGLTVGDFTVSDIHANFIINKGIKKGKIEDLKELLKTIKEKVRKKYQIELDEEVIVI